MLLRGDMAGKSSKVAIRKPEALREGDLVAVIAPGAAVDGAALSSGVRFVERAGFRVAVGAATRNRSGYLAGTDEERLNDLHASFADPEVKAILTARGGYGSGRLLDNVDLELIRNHPKILVGHSDITFLLDHIVQDAGVVTFHGPMVCGLDRQPDAGRNLLGMLTGSRGGWHQAAAEVIQPGIAEGMLVGGCLSAVVAMIGTPRQIDTDGCLLFLEDVNEKPFRIDRMLTQMRQAGLLDNVAGVLFGDMAGCTAGPDEAVSVRDVIGEAFRDAAYPVAFGLSSGHGSGTATLPFGIRARLAGERLALLESPLADGAL
jgi:muramoyltetrapeptide carboxypeptidase